MTTCASKKLYTDERAAKKAAQRLRKTTCNPNCSYYFCPTCRAGYHITRQKHTVYERRLHTKLVLEGKR